MSKRITFDTDMTDRVVMERALTNLKWGFAFKQGEMHIKDGPLGKGYFDMESGKFHGDSDWHKPAAVSAFGQAYGEALWQKRIDDEGGYIESRTVLQDGTIRIVADVVVA